MDDKDKQQVDPEGHVSGKEYTPKDLDEHEPDPSAIREGDEEEDAPETDFGVGGVGTDEPGFVGTDQGAVERDKTSGVGTPDDEKDHLGDVGRPPEEIIPSDYKEEGDEPTREEDAREELERQSES